jgi:hypothetical protein
MSESKEAWDRVGDTFTDLGRTLKSHYDRRSASGESKADREAVERALSGMREAVNRALESVNDAVGDPDVRNGANRAVSSFADALSTTFGEVSTQVRDAISKRRGQS